MNYSSPYGHLLIVELVKSVKSVYFQNGRWCYFNEIIVYDNDSIAVYLDMGFAGNLPAKMENGYPVMPKIDGKFVIIAGKNL